MPISHGGIVCLTPELKEALQSFLDSKDFSEPLLNLVRAALAAHEQAFHFPELSKEDFLKFMDEAWESGSHQLKISRCEVEGGFTNAYGLACNFAAHVAMFGKKKGLLEQEESVAD